MYLNFRESAFLRYSVAILSVEFATLSRMQLDSLLGDGYPYVTFYMALLISIAVGGWKSGLLALGLGALSAAYFFISPRHVLGFGDLGDQIGLITYLIVGATAI